MRSSAARYALLVMLAISLLNYFDRQILAGAGSAIQADLHISDGQFGLAATAFFFVYTLTVIPFAIWADRGVRKTVISVGVLIWSLATLATGLANNLFTLLLTRGLVGVGEASYFPAGTSLLADYYPKERRGRIQGAWNASQLFGAALGFIGGGLLAQYFGWRNAFFFACVPGLILAGLALTMREPKRGSAEPAGSVEHTPQLHLNTIRHLIRIRSLQALILSDVFQYIVLGGLSIWLQIYLRRYFGLSSGRAGIYAGAMVIIGGLLGSLGGGWLGDTMHRRTPRHNLLVGVIGLLLAAISITGVFLTNSVPVLITLGSLTVALIYSANPPFGAIKQNVVEPSFRASAIMLNIFVGHLLGDAWSPAYIGIISDALHDLRTALLIICVPALILAAGSAALAWRHVAGDELSMDERWERMVRADQAARL